MTSKPIPADLVIFDLDGTLLDSSQYASKAIHQAFDGLIADHPDIPKPSEAEITAQIGKAMQEFYKGLLPEKHRDLWAELHRHASSFERDFLATGTDFLFAGVRETLNQLRKAGKQLAIASNCSQDYLDAISEAYDFHLYFASMRCIGDGKSVNKSMLVRELVERFAPNGEAVMVGDRVHDGDAARAAAIPFVACDYGFGAKTEWQNAAAVIHSLPELLEIVG